MNKIEQLRQKLTGGSTSVLKPPKNTLFQEVQKVAEVKSISQQDIDSFKELPAFCEHLPFEMKKAVVALKTLHNTPYEFAVPSLLAFANCSCQHLYDVESYKYGVRPISLFVMILLDTGGSKTTIYNELKGPLRDFEVRMFDALQNEQMRFVSEEKVYKKQIKKWEDDRDNGITSQFPDKPKPAETAYYLMEKFTVNGMMDTLKSQPFTNIVSSEAGVFFSSHAFQGAKMDSTRATEMTSTLTKLWDGDNLQRNIKDENIILRNKRVANLLMLQGFVAKNTLGNKMFQEQGFTHRILIAQVQPFEKPVMSFKKDALERERLAKQQLQPYLKRLEEILDIRPRMLENRDFELNPIIVESDDDAREYMANFYNDTLHLGKEGQKLELYEGFANRLHEHCIRIAATIAIFNNHDKIELVDAKCAVDLMNMFIEHRYQLEMGINDRDSDMTQGALMLYKWFKENQDKKPTKRELRNSSLNSVKPKNMGERQFADIMEELIKSERVIAIEEIAKNGKKIQRYQYNHD